MGDLIVNKSSSAKRERNQNMICLCTWLILTSQNLGPVRSCMVLYGPVLSDMVFCHPLTAVLSVCLKWNPDRPDIPRTHLAMTGPWCHCTKLCRMLAAQQGVVGESWQCCKHGGQNDLPPKVLEMVSLLLLRTTGSNKLGSFQKKAAPDEAWYTRRMPPNVCSRAEGLYWQTGRVEPQPPRHYHQPIVDLSTATLSEVASPLDHFDLANQNDMERHHHCQCSPALLLVRVDQCEATRCQKPFEAALLGPEVLPTQGFSPKLLGNSQLHQRWGLPQKRCASGTHFHHGCHRASEQPICCRFGLTGLPRGTWGSLPSPLRQHPLRLHDPWPKIHAPAIQILHRNILLPTWHRHAQARMARFYKICKVLRHATSMGYWTTYAAYCSMLMRHLHLSSWSSCGLKHAETTGAVSIWLEECWSCWF